MRVVAGIDVGNATTEVVLADVSQEPPAALAWDRAPTRGRKGSASAAEGAAALTRRLATWAHLTVDTAVLAPQHPVDTDVAVRPRSAEPTGRLRVAGASAVTPGTVGTGAGRPALVQAPVLRDEPVVLCVPAGTGFAPAAARIRVWLEAGADVRGVLVADDEGVLLAHRLPHDAAPRIPVLDGVDVPLCSGAVRVAVEVCPPGTALTQLSDPLRLVALLGLDDADRADAVRLARALADSGSAVVALLSESAGAVVATAEAVAVQQADDRWEVDLDALAADVELRREPGRRFGRATAALRSAGVDQSDAASVVAAALGVRVLRAASETAAARAGALTTPGARAGALVLDLGGGTLDAILPDRHAVVAGGGELVGAATAALLEVPRGAAEWVKRGPCYRIENPGLALGEDGTRVWLDRQAPAAAAGSLAVPGPAGWLPFSRTLAPSEWRAVRLHLKRKALGENVSRLLTRLSSSGLHGEQSTPGEVVLVGGAAGDAELLRTLQAALGTALPDVVVGRGDVAGSLGHRYAVAYGLVHWAASGSDGPNVH